MRTLRCLALRLGAVAGLLPLAASAWEIVPSASIGEYYTTNVTLAPRGQEESDFITRVVPSISILQKNSYLDLKVNYSLEGLFYAGDSRRNSLFNQLASVGLLNLWGEDLQLRGQASIAQVNIAPELPTTSSNLFDTGNRTDAKIWDLGPVWKHRFGQSEVTGYARYGQVLFNDPEVQDANTLSGHMSIHSFTTAPKTITYDLAYGYDRIDYDLSGAAVSQSVSLRLGYRITSDVEVFALGGLDNDFTNPTSSTKLDQPRWEAGAASDLGVAGRIEGAIGHRYFGTTWRFSWTEKLPDSTYKISWSEEPSTTDVISLREIGTTQPGTPPGAEPPPDSNLGRPGTLDKFIRKRGDASAEWKTFRSTLNLDLYYENRSDQVTDPSLPQPPPGQDESAAGVIVGVTWQLGLRTTTTLKASYSHRDLLTPDATQSGSFVRTSDDYYDIAGDVDYRLGQKTDLRCGVGFDSRVGSSSGGTSDYHQYYARIELSRRF